MQVSVENTSSIERRLKIQVPAEEVQKQINARLREIGKQVRLKGFRPGRIPFSVLKQRYGPQAAQEVIQQTTQASLQQAIQDESLRIAATPRIEEEPLLMTRMVLKSTPLSKFILSSVPLMWLKSPLISQMSVLPRTTLTKCWKL